MSIIYVAIRQLALRCFRNHNQQRVPAFCLPNSTIFDNILILLNTKKPLGLSKGFGVGPQGLEPRTNRL